MSSLIRHSLVKPTLQTRFHIDFDWWAHNDRNWRVHLRNLLCSEHQAVFSKIENSEFIDWVDPKTAEVRQVDGLQHVLRMHCAKQDDFISPHTSLVEAVFRVFLANDNTPLTAVELAERLGRPPEMILRTLAGPQVYKGLRPYSRAVGEP